MKSSPVCRLLILPRFQWGLPVDYFLFLLTTSLVGGGIIVGKWIIGSSTALIGCASLTAVVLWFIGFLKARKDPEFFGVWFVQRFKLGQTTSTKRSYEP